MVKIHFRQGVSQKTWSKKELTDICAAFCAGVEASKLQPGFAKGGYVQDPFIAKLEAQLMQPRPAHYDEREKVEPSKKQVADFWGTVAAKPDLEPAPVERLG